MEQRDHKALRVCISHADQDRAFAEQLAADLRRAGAEAHLMPPSPDVASSLEGQKQETSTLDTLDTLDTFDTLDVCDVLVVALTPHALSSEWVLRDMASTIARVSAHAQTHIMSQQLQREPIIILAQPTPDMEAMIPPSWRAYPRIDATHGYLDALPAIIRVVGLTLPQTPPSPTPVPSREHPLSRRLFLIGAGGLAMTAAGVGTLIVRTRASGKAGVPGAARPPTATPRSTTQSGLGAMRWSFMAGGRVRSALAVVNGVVYAGAEDILMQGAIYALDANTGTQLWRFKTNGLVSSPAVANGIVYVGSDNHNVYALDAVTGTQRWRFATGNKVKARPAVTDGLVFLGSDDHYVYALDAMTGARQWRFSTGDTVASWPVVADGLVYIGSHDHHIYALDAATGAQQWSFITDSPVSSAPAVANGIVYCGSDDGIYHALDTATGTERWSFLTGDSQALALPDDMFVISRPVTADGLVYIGSLDGRIHALDATGGAVRWSVAVGGPVSSAPTVANGMVYIGSDDSWVYALDATSGGAQRWSVKTRGPVLSTPAVANGLLVIGSDDGNVYAFSR